MRNSFLFPLRLTFLPSYMWYGVSVIVACVYIHADYGAYSAILTDIGTCTQLLKQTHTQAQAQTHAHAHERTHIHTVIYLHCTCTMYVYKSPLYARQHSTNIENSKIINNKITSINNDVNQQYRSDTIANASTYFLYPALRITSHKNVCQHIRIGDLCGLLYHSLQFAIKMYENKTLLKPMQRYPFEKENYLL